MKLLLDTHTFLWYITNDPKLPRHAYDAIREKSNEAFLSVVSVWEALVKYQIGKLPLPAPADEYIEDRRGAHHFHGPFSGALKDVWQDCRRGSFNGLAALGTEPVSAQPPPPAGGRANVVLKHQRTFATIPRAFSME